jgi:hypothetical protein
VEFDGEGGYAVVVDGWRGVLQLGGVERSETRSSIQKGACEEGLTRKNGGGGTPVRLSVEERPPLAGNDKRGSRVVAERVGVLRVMRACTKRRERPLGFRRPLKERVKEIGGGGGSDKGDRWATAAGGALV